MPACSENPPARAAPVGWPKFVRITGIGRAWRIDLQYAR